jgi:tripartite-type tricarboxylate transporter receptor subunit TctC
MVRLTRRRALHAGLGAAAALARPAGAQPRYPDRPVTIVVPWAPGGTTDILARILAEPLRRATGQPFVVENRSGAAGNLGSAAVARARPDGHTLLFGSMSTHTMNHALFRDMPFDGVADFAPVAMLAFALNTMVVHPSVPATDVAGFIAHARANPGRVAYASAGPGSTNHVCAEMFGRMAGVEMVHVPYRGGAPAVADTVAGQTALFFSAATQTLPHVEARRLRLLGVTEARRSALLPGVPTVGETVPGYEMTVWYGVLGPKGLPPEIVAALNAEINRAMALPEVRDRLAAIGVEVINETPDAFARVLRADAEKWGRAIREMGIGMQDA